MAKQIRPRACVAMKLMASGVIISAAIVRSPLFSRFFVVDNNDHASSLELANGGVDASETPLFLTHRTGARTGLILPFAAPVSYVLSDSNASPCPIFSLLAGR